MKKFACLFAALSLACAFTACGGDDESSSGSSDIPQTSKRVAKIISEEGGSIYEDTYIYDSQGRVTKIIETESGTYQDIRTEITYQYGETVIIKKEFEEGISNGKSYSWSGSYAYTVENGRIVKYKQGSTTTTYSYDANNYLSSIRTEYSDTESKTSTITWSNGNLIKDGDMTFSYSNYSWVKGIPFKLIGDSYLFSMGYYGNTPRNLPSKMSNRSALTEEWINDEIALYEWSYEYTLQDNYVTKMIAKPTRENNKYHINTSTIIWE